jgi:hypothetical protein
LVVAGLIHEEIAKLYSDTGVISDEAMQELICSSKEVLKTSREVSFIEVSDFSFARRAVDEIRERRNKSTYPGRVEGSLRIYDSIGEPR